MNKVKIIQGEDGRYVLENCPQGFFKQPLACQTQACPYWDGYVFENVCHLGFKDYLSSIWRKSLYGKTTVATYVRCNNNSK